MPRIVNNRICYADHNVVLDSSVARNDSILAMASLLSEQARPAEHARELRRLEHNPLNEPTIWSIELPIVKIEPMYNSENQERHPTYYLPGQMLCTITLHNGNYQKIIFFAQCCKEQGFKRLWDKAYQNKIKIGKAQRRVAEAQYLVAYEAAVKAYNPPMVDTTL